MRYEMFEMKQYYTLGSVDSNTRLIQTILLLEVESIWNRNSF